MIETHRASFSVTVIPVFFFIVASASSLNESPSAGNNNNEKFTKTHVVIFVLFMLKASLSQKTIAMRCFINIKTHRAAAKSSFPVTVIFSIMASASSLNESLSRK